jgi:hypothetical protein
MFITPKMRESPEAIRKSIMPWDSPLMNCDISKVIYISVPVYPVKKLRFPKRRLALYKVFGPFQEG